MSDRRQATKKRLKAKTRVNLERVASAKRPLVIWFGFLMLLFPTGFLYKNGSVQSANVSSRDVIIYYPSHTHTHSHNKLYVVRKTYGLKPLTYNMERKRVGMVHFIYRESPIISLMIVSLGRSDWSISPKL